jgi:hypothetical protein
MILSQGPTFNICEYPHGHDGHAIGKLSVVFQFQNTLLLHRGEFWHSYLLLLGVVAKLKHIEVEVLGVVRQEIG